jgi:trigger factor
LAGKKVNFKINFREIRQTVPHQADEAFAKSQGFETLDALREVVCKSLVDSGEVLSGMVLRNSLKKQLGTLQAFDVPASWMQSALSALRRDAERKGSGSDGSTDEGSADSSKLTPAQESALAEQAAARVRADCIIQKVVRDQRFSVSDAELFAYAKAMAQSQKRSIDEVVGFLRRNKNVVDRMSNEIQERKALDWMSGQCTIEDKEVSFEGLKDLFGAAEDSL